MSEIKPLLNSSEYSELKELIKSLHSATVRTMQKRVKAFCLGIFALFFDGRKPRSEMTIHLAQLISLASVESQLPIKEWFQDKGIIIQ